MMYPTPVHQVGGIAGDALFQCPGTNLESALFRIKKKVRVSRLDLFFAISRSVGLIRPDICGSRYPSAVRVFLSFFARAPLALGTWQHERGWKIENCIYIM